MYGNDFGLFGGRRNGRRLLRSLRPLGDRIVATSNDPYATQDPVHLAYLEWNRRRHRMPGQPRRRIRYRDLVDPWFDYLLVYPPEIEELVDGTRWRITRLLREEGSYYVVVLQ